MSTKKTVFVCSQCGQESSRWLGKCPGCGEWNTMQEQAAPQKEAPKKHTVQKVEPVRMSEISSENFKRYSSGYEELNRVLGGGIVPGSVVLLGGDPGIGKSTLLLQVTDYLTKSGLTVLYLAGEESPQQIKLRAERLGLTGNAYLLAQNNVEAIEEVIEQLKPDFIVADSIQTLYRGDLSSAPGSVSQVRESAAFLLRIAKHTNSAVFLVGHVTKEGALAGPRILEHMVDTVLYFEGERQHAFRILRTVKNRFGSTNEIGVFEMQEQGMVEVKDPSAILLPSYHKSVPGSAVVCSMEGTRPVLVELQALISKTAFGLPRRMATGVDYNRMVLLMAVLEKKVGMVLGDQDAYVNVAGGFRLSEPAVDLGMIASIASSFRNRPVLESTVILGEVGLAGEVRPVSRIDQRVSECQKMGFARCILPKGNTPKVKGVELIPVSNIGQALDRLF